MGLDALHIIDKQQHWLVNNILDVRVELDGGAAAMIETPGGAFQQLHVSLQGGVANMLAVPAPYWFVQGEIKLLHDPDATPPAPEAEFDKALTDGVLVCSATLKGTSRSTLFPSPSYSSVLPPSDLLRNLNRWVMESSKAAVVVERRGTRRQFSSVGKFSPIFRTSINRSIVSV